MINEFIDPNHKYDKLFKKDWTVIWSNISYYGDKYFYADYKGSTYGQKQPHIKEDEKTAKSLAKKFNKYAKETETDGEYKAISIKDAIDVMKEKQSSTVTDRIELEKEISCGLCGKKIKYVESFGDKAFGRLCKKCSNAVTEKEKKLEKQSPTATKNKELKNAKIGICTCDKAGPDYPASHHDAIKCRKCGKYITRKNSSKYFTESYFNY